MKPSGVIVSAAVAIFVTASAARGQGGPGFHFGVTGGADFPVQDQKDVYKTGWNAGALLAINFGTSPVGIRIDGAYHELKLTDELQAFFGDAKTRIISGTADLTLGARSGAFQPYVMGGVGIYDLRFRGQEIDTGNAFSDSTTKFGWNAGAGFAFPLGTGGSRIFVEGRYTSITLSGDRFTNTITTHGSRFTLVPVNVGFVF